MKSMRVKALRRVVHTIPSVADASNGYTVAALRLCENLIGLGVDVQLASIDKKGHRKMPDYVRLFPMSPGPRRLGVSAQMHQWLRKSAAAGETGLIHTHSLWQMPCVYPGWVSQWSWTPSVVSPHGTLAAAAFESGSRVKKPFWRFVQKPALDSATAFCATAQTELEDIRKHGFRQPIALLPIGVEVPQFERMQPKRRTALYLSRVHPIKQPDMLIRAWAKLWQEFPEWDLRIVGPDYDNPGYIDEMKRLAGELGVQRARFDGELTGDDKLDAYRSADVYVLPTKTENFGITIAEALAAGTPVIVTTGAPWGKIVSHGAGWWIEQGVDPLIAAMRDAMKRTRPQLAEMGERGRRWMLDEYQWSSVTARTLALYDWIISGMPRGDRPSWVNVLSSEEESPAAARARQSSQNRSAIVLRILRGESLEVLSRELGVPTAKLAEWRDEGLAAMEARLKAGDTEQGT